MFQRLSARQKSLWGAMGTVIGIGSIIKFGYFYISREMIVKNLSDRDKEARSYLQESRDFASWAAEDRNKRATEITPEQREQLQQYLIMMAESNKDVYPYESKTMKVNVRS